MATGKRAQYDDDALVTDIAAGNLTYAQIGKKHSLSEPMVSLIARGERRPELQEKIKAASEGLIERAKRRGAALADKAMSTLGKIAEGKTDTARKAAVDLLKFTVGDPSKPEVNVNQSQGLPGLDAEDLEAIAERKHGPKD